MIYVNSNTNFIEIPRHFDIDSVQYLLRLVNNMTQQDYNIQVEKVESSKLLYKIYFDMSDLKDGEYSYYFNNEFGLMVFGDYKRTIKSYQTDNKKIQYKG